MTDIEAIVCGNCGVDAEKHCSGACTWWVCKNCGSWGDSRRRRMIVISHEGSRKIYDIVEYGDGE
jgi:hypothetical protein